MLISYTQLSKVIHKILLNLRKLILHKSEMINPVLIKVYEIKEEERQYLEVINLLPTRMEVLNIEWAKRAETARRPFISSQSFPQVLEASPYWDHSLKSRSKLLRFPLEKFKDMDDWEVIVTARIFGKEVIHHVKAEPYYTPLTKSPIPESTVTDQLKIHKFFDFKPQTNTLSVKRGEWNVKGWIIIPKGIQLIIPAGVTLSFGFNGGLLSRGALEFEGSEDEPILLKASGEGERKSWLGVAVLNVDEVSKWKYVRVTDTRGLKKGKWELSGGVTFHKSDILMDYCVLERHKGEDALNIIRSNFKLNNIRIKDTQSDAFDSDFSNGEIVGGKFQNIGKGSGGDAIDLSGSRITVNGTKFMNVSDKAFFCW